MNYRDLQNISHLTQDILTESASEPHDPMNRWPYASPYLQEDRSGYGDDSKFKQDTDADSFRPGKDVPKPKSYGRISRYSPMGKQRSRTASNVTRTVGEDPGAPRAQKIRREPRLVKKDGKWVKVDEDFALWMDSLLDEGYDLSDYTLDEMLEVYLDESAAGDVAARAAKLSRQRGQTSEKKGMYKSLSQKAAMRASSEKSPNRRQGLTQTERDARRESEAEHDWDEVPGKHGSHSHGQGGITKNPRKLAQQKARGQHAESYDLYDVVLAHLIDEGYADTQESANAIMANMSEEWVNSIVEG